MAFCPASARGTARRPLKEISEWAGIRPPHGTVLAEGRRLGALSDAELRARERVEAVVCLLSAAYVDQPEPLRFHYFDLA